MLSFKPITVSKLQTPIDYLFDETMKHLYKYFRPYKFPNYINHQLFLNPFTQVVFIIRTSKLLLNDKSFISKFNRQNFIKNKHLKFDISIKVNKDSINKNKIRLMLDDIEFLYKFRDNFKLDLDINIKEDSEIDSFLTSELIDLYDSKNLIVLHKALSKVINQQSFDLDSYVEEYFLTPEHILYNEFIDRSQRFYNNLLDYQMNLPNHIINMIKVYLSYEFTDIKLNCKKYKFISKNKYKIIRDYSIDKLTIEEILVELNSYFGSTLDIYNPYLKEFDLNTEQQTNFKFYVPIMDFIDDYKIYRFENIS